jgi:hypothetical protein
MTVSSILNIQYFYIMNYALYQDTPPIPSKRYDLSIPAEKWETKSAQALKGWLDTPQARTAINNLGGYDTSQTGTTAWIA